MATTRTLCEVECAFEIQTAVGYTTLPKCELLDNKAPAACLPNFGPLNPEQLDIQANIRTVSSESICVIASTRGTACKDQGARYLCGFEASSLVQPCSDFYTAPLTIQPSRLSTSRVNSAFPTPTTSPNVNDGSIPGQNSNSGQVDPAISSSTDTPASTNSPRKGTSGGIIAGAAIGSLIAGALLAGIVFLFLLKRYRKRHEQQQQNVYAQHLPTYNPDAAEKAQQVSVAQKTIPLVDTYLPQPAEDDSIKGEMSRLRDKIKNHVQSYYHTSPVNQGVVDQSRLLDLAAAAGISAQRLQELLVNSHTRLNTIRLYIAWVILSRAGIQKSGGSSFLPGEVAAFAAFLSASDIGNAGKIALGSKWKAISGELLQSRYGHQTTDNAHLEQSISQAIAVTDAVLAPFINAQIEATSDKRIRNLDGIMRRAAQFAFLLFSQPSSFTFDWASQQGRLVVFPGLLQIVGEDGYAVQPPRVFNDPEVVAA